MCVGAPSGYACASEEIPAAQNSLAVSLVTELCDLALKLKLKSQR